MHRMLKKAFKKKSTLFVATAVVFIMVVSISAVWIFQHFKQSIQAPDRRNYRHIAKIKVNYYQLSSSNTWSEQNQWILDSEQTEAIVTEVDSLSTGGWFQTFGKVPAHQTSIHLYTNDTNHKKSLFEVLRLPVNPLQNKAKVIER